MGRRDLWILAVVGIGGAVAGAAGVRLLDRSRAHALAWHSTEERGFKTQACRERPPAPRAADRPVERMQRPLPVVRLVDLPATVTGAPSTVGVLRRFAADELATWGVIPGEGGILLQSPVLEPIAGATRLRVTLRPRGARTVQIVPTPNAEILADDREMRGIAVALEDVAQTTVAVRIDTVLTEGWLDHRADGALRRIELATPNVLAGPEVVELVVEGPTAAFDDAAAGVTDAEAGGVLRPSWFVHAGSSATFHVEHPGTLSWHGASVGPATGTVTAGAARSVATSTWTRATLPVPAPTPVTLSCVGEGVCLFGDPTIAGPSSGTDVLVWLVDTLRADHLGVYGSPIPTPAFDAVARRGVVFGMAIAPASWTKPSVPSILTGLHPTTHQVGQVSYTDRLPRGVPMVHEPFRAAGWRTASFAANPLGSTLSGLARGFDAAWPPAAWRADPGDLPEPAAGQLTEALLGWIDEEPDRPFYAWVHTMEPHGWDGPAYAGPPRGRSSYDLAVADADRGLAAALEALRARGRDPVVVIVADHGESFRDHGVVKHGTSLFQSQVHVPLIVAGPGIPAATIPHPVSLVDVAPTLLDLAGLPPLADIDGVSLLPAIGGAVPRPFAPASRVRFVWKPFAPPIYALVTAEGSKLIRSGDQDLAFDLTTDPCEAHGLPAIARSTVDALERWIAEERAQGEAFLAAHPPEGGAIDADDVELLRELGYVE